ncbi:MAG: hypothetical protein Q7S92_03890 [Candidatus Diapherotrites archaeon]|nr:hypothetical protein [Candidatus Diapherotrites archaeon]
MDDEKLNAIIRRLDATIVVLLNQDKMQAMNLKEKVIALSNTGLKDPEIATMLGIKAVTVRAIKSKERSDKNG